MDSAARVSAHSNLFLSKGDAKRSLAFAVGLEVTQRIVDDGKLAAFVKLRYSSFDAGNGKKFEKGSLKFEDLAALATDSNVIRAHGSARRINQRIVRSASAWMPRQAGEAGEPDQPVPARKVGGTHTNGRT